ncbi:MAG: Ig-like domain-containing protein [Gammaproteobacteria bacterium]
MTHIKNAHRIFSLQYFAVCVVVIGVLSVPAFAAVLDSAPITLSDYGLQQGGLLGWSLALSPDGKVAVGGAVATNRSGTNGTDYTGAAYVYVQSNGSWSGPITLPTSSVPTGAFFGGATAVPNDTQIIVGAQNATASGGVYVFNQTGGSWTSTPTLSALTLPTNMQGAYFGEGLAVSGNGQALFVGTRPKSGTTLGDIYTYSLSGGTWGNPVALPMTTVIAAGTDVGGVLAASANGDVLVAGAPQVNGAYGAAYVWTKSGGTWGNPVALTLPSTLGPKGTLAFFGTAVAISADGTVVLAGATGANNSTGAAYVYTQTGGTWSSTPVMLSSPLVNSNSFGSSVALSPGGATAFVGMPINDTGYIFLFTQANGNWSTPVTLSTANLPVNAFVGTVMAAADTGEELVTSGETVNSNIGGLFIYDSPATITLADSPSATAIKPGSTLTFDLTLTNADQPGSTPATTMNNVVLTDTLPTGTIYVSSNGANGTCTDSGSTVTCTLASLAPGNNSQNPWSPSITVTTPTTASVLTNTLNVSANEPLVGTTTVNTKVTNDVIPTVTNGFVSTSPNTAVSSTLVATPGFTGQKLSFAIGTKPANGSVTLNATTGAFTYTPNAGFSGTDVFIFTAGDGIVTSNSGAEIITVNAPTGPPVANNGSVTTVENLPVNGLFQCECTGSLTFSIVNQPTHGSVNLISASGGVFTYTPNTGYSGPDSFIFKVSNSLGTSAPASENVIVTVGPPVASNGSVSTIENTAVSGSLSATGGGTLSFAILGQPSHGTVSLTPATGAFTYTPTAGFTGTDSFTFTASNAGGTSNTATETVTVRASSSSPSSSSSSSSKSGGALGFPALLLLSGLLALMGGRQKDRSKRYFD